MDLSVVVGPPLSGKTTFIRSLSGQGVVHISVGKICRDEAEKDTKLGRIIKRSIQDNTFLDSAVLLPLLLDDKLNFYGTEFLLDGYPKYQHEVAPLVQYARQKSVKLFRFYCLTVGFDELLRRLHERYTCRSCYLPLRGEVMCTCGGEPFKREEDMEEYFLKRYALYLEHKEAIIQQSYIHFTEVIHV